MNPAVRRRLGLPPRRQFGPVALSTVPLILAFLIFVVIGFQIAGLIVKAGE